MTFRADIQILRGLSVLLVVLFHLGFDSFKSGFLGVDVFFVISGFLMAVLYDHKDKLGFFKRRAMRLLPAYYVVIILTLIFSVILTTRNEAVQVFEQVYYGSFFASNIGFWTHNSYFSDRNFNPLLHLWSLGVEIQFYLLIPFLYFFIRKSKWLLVLLLLASLVLCFWATTVSPKTSFFITPFRIWEFLIGYCVAVFFASNGNICMKPRRYLGSIGLLALLMIPFFPVDGESKSFLIGHPGIFALAIAIATALVLACGMPKRIEQSLIGKTLVILGKYSYSIYLVHFPIIVIYNSEPFEGTQYGSNSIPDLLLLVTMISGASFLLYRLVEIRRWPIAFANRWGHIVVAASVSAVLLTSTVDYFQLNQLEQPEQLIFKAERDRSEYRCGKVFRILHIGEPVCELTGLSDKDASGSIMLAGNSHADAVKEVFRDIARENKLHLYFFVSNSTMNKNGHSPNFIIKQAVENDVSAIFVHQLAESFDYNTLSTLVSEADSYGIRVIYLEPVPVWENDIPQSMWMMSFSENNDFLLEKNIDDYYSDNSNIFNELENIAAGNFSRMNVGNIFCKPNCLYKSSSGAPLYFDNHHLTKTGSELLYPSVAQMISRLNSKS
ncbi:acyltransferase family protein [Vreelandella populi]|uniref:Acyltransferase n=1 Tax=Vreelandella populi TaxID=2498858 RepID=A0A433LET7_9GAMM|nr:acyltransferase family protein [Halomonas populi]RUR35559.1 acyltransferase [Halomonas populi]RUR47749.1 acyltransferase [Halomonas populi]RUR54388.1 acyltransferase [Halomonas populi]